MSARIASVLVLLALIGLVHGGCASEGGFSERPILPVPPTEELRDRLGRIAVVSGRFVPSVHIIGPAKGAGEGAKRGGGTGAVGTFAGWAAWGGPYGAIVGLLTAPVGAAVGAVSGALLARPSEEVEGEFALLRTAIGERDIQGCLQAQTDSAAHRWSSEMVDSRPERGPEAIEQAADYRALHSEGIDTVFEVAVERVAVAGWGFRSPATTLFVVARTRLVRSRDNAELYGHRIAFHSASIPWQDWIAAGGALVGEQLGHACNVLGERIAEEVLSVYFAPSWRRSSK